MASDLLSSMLKRLQEDLEGLNATGDGLRAVADARYGEVVVEVEHDDEAESIRVSAAVAPPAGAGARFLVWCLSVNAHYWDVKIGLDDEGRLLVHSDLDAKAVADTDTDALATEIVDRVDTVLELLDDDYVEWLLEHGFGTPTQRERWMSRSPELDADADVED